jgi:mRNA interferase RelE/StbE
MYKIKFSNTALKRLRNIPRNLAQRIQEKLTNLANNPYEYNPNVKKLVNREGYRLRVGDWRIIYQIYDDEIVILVLDIDTRRGIYK